MFVKLYVNFVIPTCSRLSSEWCDTTACNLVVLNKTGTCFSQSGTFSSRRHPINLGINSHACASMAMLTEWQLPCHFRFVPRGEGMHAVCRLADLPELAQSHLQKEKKKKKSTLISPYVWVALTGKHGRQKTTEKGHSVCMDGVVVRRLKALLL